MPVLEVLSAALVLNDALSIGPLANGVLIFAAGGMLAIAVSDMWMNRQSAHTATVEHSGTK